MDYRPPVSSVHGILQARIPEWVTMPSYRGSFKPRYRTWVSCTAGRFFTTEPPGKPPKFYPPLVLYHRCQCQYREKGNRFWFYFDPISTVKTFQVILGVQPVLRMTLLDSCFLNVNAHINYLGILLRNRFKFSSLEVGPERCICESSQVKMTLSVGGYTLSNKSLGLHYPNSSH